METFLPLPINNLSPIPAGAAQVPAATSRGENFLQVLTQYLGKRAEGKVASKDQGLESLDSSTLANLITILGFGNPSISPETGTSSSSGPSGLKEDSASVANALLEVNAQGRELPGIPGETFAGLQFPIPSRENGAFFTSPLPSGEEKQGEQRVGADGQGNFMPTSISARGDGAFFTSRLPSGEEKQGEQRVGADGQGNFMPTSISARGDGAFLTSRLPSGEEKQGEPPVGIDGQRNFILRPVPSEKEGQTGQPGWVDRPPNPAIKAKPPEGEGSFLPEGKLEKTSPERIPISPGEIGSATIGDTGQGKIEPIDRSSQKKEIAGHPSGKEPMKGESIVATGGAEIKSMVGPATNSNQESPFLSRQERTADAEPPSLIKKESILTPVGEKHSVGEENPAANHPLQPSTLQIVGGEVFSRSHEEKDGLQVLGLRNGQTHPSGKENQTSLGSYGASYQSTAPSFGFAEKLTEGKEAFTPTRSEAQPVYQQVGERVSWLIRNQEEKIKITLDPPELGHLCLEINRTKENIQTTLLTDNPLTKATLESCQGEIQKIIENEGFKLEKFDVLVQQDLSSFRERKESQWDSDSRNSYASRKMEVPESAPLDSLSRAPHWVNSGSQYLDLFA